MCTHSVEEEGERDISVVEIDYSLQWSRGGGEEGWWLLEYDSGLDIADRKIQLPYSFIVFTYSYKQLNLFEKIMYSYALLLLILSRFKLEIKVLKFSLRFLSLIQMQQITYSNFLIPIYLQSNIGLNIGKLNRHMIHN